MKKIILIILIFFTSCKNPNTKNKDHSESNKDIEYVDLIGDFKRKDLTKSPYDSWYIENYENYELDVETAKKIKKLINRKISIKVIMGTWCINIMNMLRIIFKRY